MKTTRSHLHTDTKPWYQYPYVWLVILFPLTAVVAGIITIKIAIDSDDGLVVDDYYKKGLEINKVLERDENAKKLGLKLGINLNNSDGVLNLVLSSDQDFTPPDQISTKLMHATRDGFDQELEFNLTANDDYQSLVKPLQAGHWYIQVESGNWRIVESLYVD